MDDRVHATCHGADLEVMLRRVTFKPLGLFNRVGIIVRVQTHAVAWLRATPSVSKNSTTCFLTRSSFSMVRFSADLALIPR